MATMERPKASSKPKKKVRRQDVDPGATETAATQAPASAPPAAEQRSNQESEMFAPQEARISSSEAEDEFADALSTPVTSQALAAAASGQLPLQDQQQEQLTVTRPMVDVAALERAGQLAAAVPAWLDPTALPPVRAAAAPPAPAGAPSVAHLPSDLHYAQPPTLSASPAAALATAPPSAVQRQPAPPAVSTASPPTRAQLSAPAGTVTTAAPAVVPAASVAPAASAAQVTAGPVQSLKLTVPVTVAAPPALAEPQLEAYYPLHLVAEQPVRTARFLHNAAQAPSHPLHGLLTQYIAARAAVVSETEAAAQTRAKMESLQEKCWVLSEEKEDVRVRCRDDVNLTVTLTHTVARFQPEVARELQACHTADSDRSLNTMVRIRFECQLTRQRIEDFIEDATSACCVAAGLHPGSKLDRVLVTDYRSADHRSTVEVLRGILHVLFAFRRRGVADSTFRFDLAQWLRRCLSVALAVGTHDCSLDLLNHLVRSGNGFGEEFASFLQFNDMWSEASVQISAALLATLVSPAETLMPMDGKDSLDLLRQDSAARDESWSVVDSDLGEVSTALHNSTLGENDCTLLLNQFPMKAMMTHFYTELAGGASASSTDPLPVPAVLKLFAFMNAVLRLLCGGLSDRIRTRHTHYTRHLSRLTMQALNLLTSQWREIVTSYLAAQMYEPLFHLQAEYDGIVVRMIHRLCAVGKASTLQFLPHVALDAVSSAGAWAVLCVLCQPASPPEQTTNVDPWLRWQELSQQPDFRSRFYELMMTRSDLGVYVITTLAQLAQSRQLAGGSLQRLVEWRLVTTVTRELFLLGFSNATTASEYSKTVRDALSGLTEHHPFLLPEIFDLIHSTSLTIAPSWITATLPLKRLVLTPANARSLGADLQQPIHSKMHLFARETIAALNYGMVQLQEHKPAFEPVFFPVALPVGVDPTRIADELPPQNLPPQIAVGLPQQLELACAIAQALALLVPPEESSSLGAMAGLRKESHKLLSWAWDTVCKFSLHLLPPTDIGTSPLTDRLRQYPAQQFVQYLHVLLDRPGRDPEAFCTEGVRILTSLVQNHVITPVLSALFNLLPPLFPALYQSPLLAQFSLLVKQLVLYDVRSGSLSALPAAPPAFQPPIAVRLCELMTRHIRGVHAHLHVSHEALMPHSARALQAAELWLRVLVNVPDWHTLPTLRDCVESVIRCVADVDGSVTMISNCFAEVYRLGEAALAQPKQQKWFSFRKATQHFSLTDEPEEGVVGSILKLLKQGDGKPLAHPYLVFYAMLYETVRETSTRRSLAAVIYSHPSIKPEDACEKVGCDYETLTVLRWLKFALSMDFDHALHSLFWQFFFSLFFASVPINDTDRGRTINRCYGRTFVAKQSILDKISARLDRAVNYWRAKASESPESQHAREQQELFAAALRWIADDVFKRPDIDTAHLNDTHNIARFICLFDSPPLDALPRLEGWLWKDLFLPGHDAAERAHAHELGQHKWLFLHNPDKIASLNVPRRAFHRFHDELERLSLEDAQSAPSLTSPEPFSLQLDVISVIQDKNTLQRLRNDLESLHAAAQRHQDRLAIAFSIREEYLNLLPTLYTTNMRPTVVERRCSELPTHRSMTCSGPAVVRKDTRQATLVLDSKGRISTNRRRYADLVDEKPVPDGFVPCVLRLQRLAQGLADAVTGGRLSDSARTQVIAFGSSAFFQTLSQFTVVLQGYPPAALAMREALATFGSHFIANNPNAVMTMLLELLERTDVVAEFCHFLTPAAAPSAFVACMKTVHRFLLEKSASSVSTSSPSLSRRPGTSPSPVAAQTGGHDFQALATQAACVVTVLRRFDVNAWLADNPPLSEREDLMSCYRGIFEFVTLPASASTNDVYQPLLAYFREAFVALLSFRFPELFNHTLSFAVPLSRKRALPAELWADLVAVVTARRAVIAGRRSVDTADWIRKQWLEQRASGAMADQLEAWRPYVPSVAAFVRLLIEGLPLDELGLHGAFAIVVGVLDPWLAGQPGKAHPIGVAPTSIEAAAHFCDVLVIFLTQPAVPRPEAMTLFMDFYLQALRPGAPTHALALFHRVFAGLPFDALPLTPVLMRTVRALLAEHRDTYLQQAASFFARVLSSVNWSSAASNVQAREQECMQSGAAFDPLDSLSFFVDNAFNAAVLLASVEDPLVLRQLQTALPGLSQLPFAFLHHQAYAAAIPVLSKFPPASVFASDSALATFLLPLCSAGAQFDVSGPVDLANVLEKRLAYVRAVSMMLSRVAVEHQAPTVAYFGRLLTTIVQSCQNVHADYATYTLLLGPALCLVTAGMPPKLTEELRAAIIGVARTQPPLAMAVLQAACRSLTSLADMAQVAEACIQIRFGALHDLTPANQFGWGEVTAFFEPPELFVDEFTEAALANGCWGTLYAHARRIMQQPTPLPAVSRLYDQVLAWLSKCQPQTSSQLLEAKLVLLVELELDILVHLRRNNFELPTEPRLIALAELLDRFGNDKVGSSFLRFMSPDSPFSPAFRLYMRALAAFCAYQVLENNTLRIVVPGLPSPSPSKLAEKYLKTLASCRSSKIYAELTVVVDLAHGIILEPQMMLSTHARLASQVVSALYGDVAQLRLLMQ